MTFLFNWYDKMPGLYKWLLVLASAPVTVFAVGCLVFMVAAVNSDDAFDGVRNKSMHRRLMGLGLKSVCIFALLSAPGWLLWDRKSFLLESLVIGYLLSFAIIAVILGAIVGVDSMIPKLENQEENVMTVKCRTMNRGVIVVITLFFAIAAHSARAATTVTLHHRLNLKGHTDQINSIAFSADGKLLASASSDQTIRVWNADSGRLMRVIGGYKSAVVSVAFSPDGSMLASGDLHHLVRPFSVRTGKLIHSYKARYAVTRVAFSPDGNFLAAGTDNGTGDEDVVGRGQFLFFTIPNFRLRRAVTEPMSVTGVAIDTSSRLIAVVMAVSNGEAWDHGAIEFRDASGNRLGQLKSEYIADGNICFVKSRSFVVSTMSSQGPMIRQYTMNPGRKLHWTSRDVRIESESDVVAVTYSTYRHLIACAILDGEITLIGSDSFRIVGGKQLSSISLIDAQFRPDGRELATSDDYGKLQLWNVE